MLTPKEVLSFPFLSHRTMYREFKETSGYLSESSLSGCGRIRKPLCPGRRIQGTRLLSFAVSAKESMCVIPMFTRRTIPIEALLLLDFFLAELLDRNELNHFERLMTSRDLVILQPNV